MSFKNYLKLAVANFDKTWKLVVYRVIIWLVVFALLAPFYNVIKDQILNAWNDDAFLSFAKAGLFYGNVVTATFVQILSLVLAFLTDGLYLSKKEGGKWAKAHLPFEYQPTISEAINCYTTNLEMIKTDESLVTFANKMLYLIKDKLKHMNI